ncbi:MAG TPA: radical SAM protein [Anaerolineae bacterium]|nr:radical SAM protein [Anaerolineae bacterium]
MFSPEYVQTSMAAAKSLGYYPNTFRRGSYLRGLNLLLTYGERCVGRCAYCGLNSVREVDVTDAERTFIRVRWPTYPVSDIIARLREDGGQLQRVCVGMITHPRAFDDMNTIVHRFHTETGRPVSCLISPTVIRDPNRLAESRAAGADIATVAIDAATPEIFERYRGREVRGPHRWEQFWEMLAGAAEIFGRGHIGVHLIVGLGETEQEMVATIQRARDMGATTHLFSFFPEAGTSLDGLGQPSYGQYRRVQLARSLVDRDHARSEAMRFDDAGRIVDYGVAQEVLEECIQFGEPFMTSGCPGSNGRTACNRPFGNERPGRPIRNYAFEPDIEDVALIRYQLRDYDGLGDGRA